MRSATRKRVGKDQDYLAWIHTLACVCCGSKRVEAAHVGDRGLSQKCPDRQTIPLCVAHHRIGPTASHVLGKKFFGYWKIDRDALIDRLNQQYEALQEVRI